MSKEVEIGGKKLNEGTKIKVTFGLLAAILGFLLFGYFNIKSDIKSTKAIIEASVEKDMTDLEEDIKDIADDMEESKDDIGEIKGDVKVILDRTSNIREDNTPSIGEPNLPPE